MIYIGILLLGVGLLALAFDRAVPATRPMSTIVMYFGVSLGLILIIVGIIVYATQGAAIEVDSSGGIIVR